MRIRQGTALLCLLVLSFAAGAVAAPPDDEERDLRRAFSSFITAKDLHVDAVPDLYPGGYARISLYARRANLGGMLVDEAWFRLTGASLDPAALKHGELRILDIRDSAMHIKASIKSLEEYFQQGNPIKDIKLWSDGEYIYGQGTVLLAGIPTRVYLRGFFAVGGTKDVYFYINDLRANGIPIPFPLIKKWEENINPVFRQTLWPVTFKIRALKMSAEWFIVSSQADPNAPCHFCTGGEAPTVAP